MSRPSLQLNDIFSVEGKVVVITGGGTGLGKAIAEGFSSNGAKVYITGRRAEVLEKAAKLLQETARLGGQIIPIQGDVSTKEGCAKIVEKVSSNEQHIDVLVNNAADAVSKALWEGVNDDHFNFTNSVNLNGVYFTTVGFFPLLRKAQDPSVIVISSLAGFVNQRAMGSMTYAVSKASALHLSKLLAGRCHPMKIRVNCILPGIFPTEMTTTDNTSNADSMNKFAVKAAKRCTAGRPGKPEEIVGPCLMLASKAGGYMNGHYLLIEGGRAMGASINDGIRMPEDTYIS